MDNLKTRIYIRGIPRQIDQKNLEKTPYISDFDKTLHIGLSWPLILMVRISASSVEPISRYSLGQFFHLCSRLQHSSNVFSSWFIELI